MSAILGKAGKKLFERHLEQYAPQDPLYEFYTDAKGKQKRRQRVLPSGISARDAKILKSVQRRAHYLDKGFNFCGFRFGWTFVIGLIPVVGDVVNASINYYLVIRKSRQADIPSWLLQRMVFNNLVSAGVGFVPLVGDVIVAVYKANSRNAVLLEEMLRIRGEEYLRLQGGEEIVSSAPAGKPNGKKGKKKKGISEKDAEQVKPGSGIVQDEVISTQPILASSGSSAVGPSSAEKPASKSGKSFGNFFSKTATEKPSGETGQS